MDDGVPSRTAEGVAMIRAVESYLSPERRVVYDPYAHFFLDTSFRRIHKMMRFSPIHAAMMRFYEAKYPGLFGFVICRYRQLEDWVLASATSVQQVVLIGAGYDTKLVRLRDRLSQAELFELDHPATQGRKRKIYQARLGAQPKGVNMIAVDLTKTGLMEALHENGFRSGLRSLFILEGVLAYVPQAEIARSLSLIREHSGPGSLLLFDYLIGGMIDGSCTLEGARESIRVVSERGEPYVFGLDQPQMAAFLEDLGFAVVDDLGSKELRARFLGPRPLKIMAFARVLRATVREGSAQANER